MTTLCKALLFWLSCADAGDRAQLDELWELDYAAAGSPAARASTSDRPRCEQFQLRRGVEQRYESRRPFCFR